MEELKEHVRKHWETLQSKLRTGEYLPAAVRAVEIPKAKGGVRTLGIPTVVDRLIQQGVHQVLSPIFENDFSNQSYGFGLAVARKRRYERRRNASKRERAGWWTSI